MMTLRSIFSVILSAAAIGFAGAADAADPRCGVSLSWTHQLCQTGVVSNIGSARPALAPGRLNPTAATGRMVGVTGLYTGSSLSGIVGGAIMTATGDAAITSGAKYTSSECFRNVQRCLNRDSACGENFEYCTNQDQFAAKKTYCNDEFLRCEAAGLQSLFGQNGTIPQDGSVIANMIKDGADYSVGNAATRCGTISKRCFDDACAKNPYECENDTLKYEAACMALEDGNPDKCENRQSVLRRVASVCRDKVGTNADCTTLFSDTAIARDTDWIWEEAYDRYFPNWVADNLKRLRDAFDDDMKSKCDNQARACVAQTCGRGNGAVCHSAADSDGSGSVSSEEIVGFIGKACDTVKTEFRACKYAVDKNLVADPVGAARSLFAAELNSKFNEQTYAKTQSQCVQAVRTCAQENCGDDFFGCARSAMDSIKIVLDRNVLFSLCLETATNDANCDIYFQTQAAKKYNPNNAIGTWFGNNMTNATEYGYGYRDVPVLGADGKPTGETTRETYTASQVSNTFDTNTGSNTIVANTWDADGNALREATTIETFDAIAAVIENDVSAARMAKYNTAMNMCNVNNSSNVFAARDVYGAGYVPIARSVAGNCAACKLSDACYIKVDVRVEGSDILKYLDAAGSMDSTDKSIIKDSTYYVAAGDSFTCGAWIDDQLITNAYDRKRRSTECDPDKKEILSDTTKTLLATVAGAAAGAGAGYGVNALAERFIGGNDDPAKAKATSLTAAATSLTAAATEADVTAMTTLLVQAEAALNNYATEKAQVSAIKNGLTTDNIAARKTTALNLSNEFKAAATSTAQSAGGMNVSQVVGIGTGGVLGGIWAGIEASASIEDADEQDKVSCANKWLQELERSVQCVYRDSNGQTRRVDLGDIGQVAAM